MLSRLVALPVLAACAAAQNSVDLTGYYWIPQMASRIRVEAGGFGTDIDAQRDLGMQDTNFPSGGFTWRRGRSRLRFVYTPIDYTGDQVVTRTIVFHGVEYPVSTRVVSELEVRHLELSWAWQFIQAGKGRFRIGPMVEADAFLMHGSLAAPNLPAVPPQTETLNAGLPTAGLAMDIEAHRTIGIYAQVAGMEAGSYGYFVGSDAGVTVHAIRHVLFTAGYRTFNLHIANSPDFARLRLRGPFVGAGVRF